MREDEISGRGSSASWMHEPRAGAPSQQDPAPTSPRRHARRLSSGNATELARYTVAEGERILYGQRVDGVVRFLPGNLVVLVGSLGPTEDSTCRSRTTIRAEGLHERSTT